MTSQKRYRHYHDNNTASRFREREVPPRFKRQKSSSSPKPTPAEIPVNQENENLSHSPSTSPPLSHSTSTFSPSNTPSNTPSTPTMKQPFRIVNGQPPPPGMWQSQLPKDSLSVKTGGFVDYGYPMSELYSTNKYVNSQNYLTPPLSPWGMENRQLNVVDGVQRTHMPVYSQTPRSSPDIVYHEAVAPALEMAKAEGLWVGPSPNVVNQDRLSAASPIQSDVLLKQSHVSGTKKRVDYSDPDIRTIEMLRELERVADQKEKEDEEDLGVDRKNLVSHHLRMLMCAVDRYTADMDEDTDDSSSGKSTPPLKTDTKPSIMAKNVRNHNESNQWQIKQGRKQRSVTHHQPIQCKPEQQLEGQVLSPQIRETPKNIGKVNNMPQHHNASQQWSNMAQPMTNSIYSASWQIKQPPQSQSPSMMPVVTTVAPVQLMPSAAVPHNSLPTINTSLSSQAQPQRAVSSFSSSQVNSKSSFASAFPANFIAVQTTVPPPVTSTSDHLTPQQALAHIWSPQSVKSEMGYDESKSWDIWSGPSFVNIYSHELCNSGTRNPTELERGFLDYVNTSTSNGSKPLYMR